VTLFGEVAWIASKKDVILHKLYWMKMSPSDRQMDDVIGIMRVQGDSLDLGYLRLWAARLEVSDLLEKLLSGEVQPKRT